MAKMQKEWRELTEAQKAGIIVLGTIQVALLAAALWDLRRRPARQIKGSKKAWTAAAFVDFIGPLAYFTFGRKR